MTDKPFGEEKVVIEWDGVIGDRLEVVVMEQSNGKMSLVKVYDDPSAFATMTKCNYAMNGEERQE